MSLSLPKLEMTEQEQLDFMTTGMIFNRETLILKTKWEFLEMSHNSSTRLSVKNIIDVARKYSKVIPNPVRKELSDWLNVLKGRREARAESIDQSYASTFGTIYYKHPFIGQGLNFHDYELLRSTPAYMGLLKRWSVLLFDEIERIYKKQNMNAPRVDIEFIFTDSQSLCGVGYSKGYPTIYIPAPTHSHTTVQRWNGRTFIGNSPKYVGTFLELHGKRNKKLVAVSPCPDEWTHIRYLYGLAGFVDCEYRTHRSQGYRVITETRVLGSSKVVDREYGVKGTDKTKKSFLYSNHKETP